MGARGLMAAGNRLQASNAAQPDQHPSQPVGKPIHYPTPPLCIVPDDVSVKQGEKVILELNNGHKLIGKLEAFDSEKGNISVLLDEHDDPKIHGMHEIRLLRISTPRHWILDEESILTQAKGVKVTTEPLEYEIELTDHTTLEGTTHGFRNGRHGIYLFPVQEQNQYTHLFVPNSTITRHRIGKHLGQQLVKDKVLSDRDVAIVLMEQQDNRSRSLGEHLARTAVVSPEQLVQAIKRQTSMPHLQLGEILIQEKIITNEQLENALIKQKKQRNMTLGELLIEKGLVHQETIQQSLATKLGFPFVDLHQFPLDLTVLNLIDKEFATSHNVMPLHRYNDKLVVAMLDPTKWETIEALQSKTGYEIEPVIAIQADILWALNFYYGNTLNTIDAANAKKVEARPDIPHENEKSERNSLFPEANKVNHESVAEFLRTVILDGARRGITHIHFEPVRNRGALVRLRKDGDLSEAGIIPESAWRPLIAELKSMAKLTPETNFGAQLISVDTQFLEPARIDLQLAAIPNIDGEDDFVLKLGTSNYAPSLKEIGLSAYNLKRLLDLSDSPRGLILIAGAYDSGKSTTLSALLTHLNKTHKKIWLIGEEGRKMPEGIRQAPLQPGNTAKDITPFDVILHADPDIIGIGDLSDQSTAQKALAASLTSHLILSALSVRRAGEAIDRLINMNLPTYEIADALLAILAQRLVKKLCTHCRKRYMPNSEEMRMLVAEYCAEMYDENESPIRIKALHEKILNGWTETYVKPSEELMLYRASGCKHCQNTGYDGRIALHELLEFTPAVKRALLDSPDADGIAAAALASGMKTLKQDGIEKVLQGHTDMVQVRSACRT
jgi:type II secretory ATPase GspE/PulE/Tfp pilus assembly ATPase PilB-like protein